MNVDLLRRATDQRVVAALLDAGRLTRAELADAAEISRPTASQSIRRLTEAGLVQEGERQQGGRGRAGTYCQLVPGSALALAIQAGPGAVVMDLLDAAGGRAPLVDRRSRPVGLTATVDELRELISGLIADAEALVDAAVPIRVVSVAGPVDVRRATLVRLSSAPFVVDEGSVADVIGPFGLVDNDVVWAAAAEMAARGEESFLYVYLGEGVGAAVVDRGRVVQGRRGLAGEIAYMSTVGPEGRSMSLVEVFTEIGLTVPGTSALDLAAVRKRLDDPQLVDAVGGALSSGVALLDPGLIVLGGPWGIEPALVQALSHTLTARGPYPVRVEPAQYSAGAALAGARSKALELARARVLEAV